MRSLVFSLYMWVPCTEVRWLAKFPGPQPLKRQSGSWNLRTALNPCVLLPPRHCPGEDWKAKCRILRGRGHPTPSEGGQRTFMEEEVCNESGPGVMQWVQTDWRWVPLGIKSRLERSKKGKKQRKAGLKGVWTTEDSVLSQIMGWSRWWDQSYILGKLVRQKMQMEWKSWSLCSRS